MKEAAGFWTLLLTFVAGHGGLECRVKIDPLTEYSDLYLAEWFGSKPQVVIKCLSRAAQLSLICKTEWDNNHVIFIPNLLKRLDDYTRRVRTHYEQSPKKSPLEEEVDIKKKEIEIHSHLHEGFERLWAQYPNKDGRKDAEKHFKSTVKNDSDLSRISVALSKYLAHLEAHSWKHAKGGKTWFNNWTDWENWVDPPETNSLEQRKRESVVAPLQQPSAELTENEMAYLREMRSRKAKKGE